MLIEWATALELHQRGHVKVVLPMLHVLVGETDFWSVAHAAFGEVRPCRRKSRDSLWRQR
jgi:hypothetical protein